MTRMGKRSIATRTTAIALTIAAVFGRSWWGDAHSREATENAYVHGDIPAIAPKVSGYVAKVLVQDTGNFVRVVQRVPVKIRLDRENTLLGRLVPGMSVDVTVDLPAQAESQRPASQDATASLFRRAN